METFAANEDQIIIAFLAVEKINNVTIKEKSF